MFSLGIYTDAPLSVAREGRDSTRRQTAGSVNPSAKRKTEKAAARDDSNNCTKIPSAAERIFLARAGLCQSRWATWRQHGFEALQQLTALIASARRKPDGLKAVSELVIAWTACRFSAVPTATNGICNSLPSQRSEFRNRRC